MRYLLIILLLSSCGTLFHDYKFAHIEVITYDHYKKSLSKDSVKYKPKGVDTFNIVYKYIYLNDDFLYESEYVRCNQNLCIWDDRRNNYELTYKFISRIVILDSLYYEGHQQQRKRLYVNSVKQCQVKNME